LDQITYSFSHFDFLTSGLRRVTDIIRTKQKSYLCRLLKPKTKAWRASSKSWCQPHSSKKKSSPSLTRSKTRFAFQASARAKSRRNSCVSATVNRSWAKFLKPL